MASVNVRKRGEKWEYRFEAAKVNGKRKHISKGGFRTKKDALEAGTKALVEYNNGGHIAKPSEMSLNDYLDEWMEKYVKVNLRHKTELCYKGIIENHLKTNLGHYKLSALNPALLQEFANDLKAKGYSKRHIENIVSTLNNALNYAVSPLQYIQFNYAQHIKIPKIDREPKKRNVVTPENFDKIISRFPFGNKYHIPLMIGYHTGMRISEVHGLTWDDIDLENGVINVDKQSIRYKPEGEKIKWCLGPTKSKAGVRHVKIGSTLLETLKKENIRQKQNRLLYGEYFTKYTIKQVKDRPELLELVPSKENEVNLVCINDDGMINTTDSFKYCSRIIHHELKIEDFDFHSLRHTHASILVNSGLNPKSLQNRLGHEKITTTLQIYSHESREMFEETGELFERALRGQNKKRGQDVDKRTSTTS